MARMASRPRIGAIIRDGMERKGMDQTELARAVGKSRSAVNSWINDRSWPLNRVAMLEDLLDIKIPRTAGNNGTGPRVRDEDFTSRDRGVVQPDMADPAEALVWRMTRYGEAERREFILDLRARRRAAAGTG